MRVVGQPPLLRRLNQRAILELLRKDGPMSRAELARALHLSKSTVSQVVSSLLERGLVQEARLGRPQDRPGALGRRAVRLDVASEAGFVIGIDLGGTLLRVAVADLRGEVRARHCEPTDRRGLSELLTQMEEVTRRVVTAASVPWARLLSVVVGVPGAVSVERRHVELCPNLPFLEHVDLGRLLGERLRSGVQIENDVNLAAVGEKWRGCAQGVHDFTYIAVGTGLGMGIVLEDRLYRGPRGLAGEIAYLPYPAATAVMPLEAVVSGGAISRRFGVEARELFQAARAGDRKALKAIDELGAALGWAVASVVAMLDVALVVLGGGIGQNTDLLLSRIGATVASLVPVQPAICPSALGGEATLYGAIGVALRSGRDTVEEASTDVVSAG